MEKQKRKPVARKWTVREEKELLALAASYKTDRVAAILHRSVGAVRDKLRRMKGKTPKLVSLSPKGHHFSATYFDEMGKQNIPRESDPDEPLCTCTVLKSVESLRSIRRRVSELLQAIDRTIGKDE